MQRIRARIQVWIKVFFIAEDGLFNGYTSRAFVCLPAVMSDCKKNAIGWWWLNNKGLKNKDAVLSWGPGVLVFSLLIIQNSDNIFYHWWLFKSFILHEFIQIAFAHSNSFLYNSSTSKSFIEK